MNRAQKLNYLRETIRVYQGTIPQMLEKGRITKERADYELEMLHAIAKDYEEVEG